LIPSLSDKEKERKPHRSSSSGKVALNIPLKPVFQTYQMSAVPSLEEQVVSGPNQIKHIPPEDTLNEFNVDEATLCLWVENLREWMSTKVFHPLVSEMRKVEFFLEQRGWSHLSLKQSVPAIDPLPVNPQSVPPQPAFSLFNRPSNMFGSSTTSSTQGTSSKPPTSLNGLATALPNVCTFVTL
jgi:hypothetical protein